MQLDPDELAEAFGRPVTSYDIEHIDPELRLHSVTGGLFRVRADGESLVVKVVRHGHDTDPDALWVAGAEPSHRNYWKREWLAFDSRLLDSLPGPLRAPRTRLTTEHGHDECWIWMEDVKGRTGAQLEPDDYVVIAGHLGRTQGAYAADAVRLPDDAWLSRDWLRSWVAICAKFVSALEGETWSDERLSPLRALAPRILELWGARDDLLAIVDSAPRTIVHFDFWPPNLFATGDDDSVAIDWSQVGIGGVGQDLDQMTLDPVWMQVRPDEPVAPLERRLLASYLDGLHAAGCDVGPKELKRWYAAAAAARYAWMGGSVVAQSRLEHEVDASERRFGRDFGSLVADRARVVDHAVALGEAVLLG